MTNRYLIAHYAICLLVGLIIGALCKYHFNTGGTQYGFIVGLGFVATSFIKTQIEDRFQRH